ncbi:MAG: family 20 glycosylhydrolase [Promethearchaeati archaeon]
MDSQLKFIIISGLESVEENGLKQPIFIPEPKEIIIEDEHSFKIGSNSPISFVNVENQEILFNNLMEFFEEYPPLSFNIKDTLLSDSKILEDYKILDLFQPEDEESYNLNIAENKIIIYSLHEKGLFYGIQTLIQIIKNSILQKKVKDPFEIIVPSVLIRDIPDLKVRGVAQDISRGQICSVENAKRYIKLISHYKMNFYCLYIEDMFAHPNHPLIGKERGALTCEEIKEIDTYAREHFIELVPIFECLGHMDNILQHMKYRNLGEFPGAHSLDISNQEIYPFLKDYISEISKCFSTNYFHIGCDESFDVGRYNSEKYIEKVGKSEALANFYNKIYDIASTYDNNNIIMYDDIVRKDNNVLEKLNKEMILMYWEYNPKIKNPPVEKFLESGHRVIVSPSMLNWNRNFPDNKNASKNIINMINIGFKFRNEGCLGVLTSTWGDQRYFSLRENEIFGAILSADKAWNVKHFEYDQFKEKFGFLFYGIEENYLEDFNQLYTLLSSSAEKYYRLRLILPPLFYTDLFKHPFPAKKFKPGLKKYNELLELGTNCLNLYNKLLPKIKLEKDNFEYIGFGAELAKYCGEKIKLSVDISDHLRRTKLDKVKIEKIIQDIEYIRDKVKYLKEKYQRLWLRAAKRPCLDYNLRMFDYLIDAYWEKISQLRNKIYFRNPFLESEWIWADEKTCPKKPRFFRKIFTIEKPINKALIQATVCNHMKIYLNQEYVGEVLGRFSLSRLPIIFRVRVFDITEYLKEGKNIISIEATNYDGLKGAFNIFAEIEQENGLVQELISDKTWLYTKNQKLGSLDHWKTLEFNDNDWRNVKSYGPPPNLNGDLKKPNLLNGEISLTQNYFSAQGYYFAGIEIFFGKIIRFFLKYLIGFIVKRAKLFG